MRKAPNLRAERFRNHDASRGLTGVNSGAFLVPCKAAELRVIISDGGGWDHVSVSLSHRCPTWEEMCFVKELFFKDEECVMQLHPAKDQHISFHNFCLHLWRPQTPEENEASKAEYSKDRERMTERERSVFDPIELATCPGPIPLPPSIMVGPKT
jgi:hypothetical protein